MPNNREAILMDDYDYVLPEDRIARFPLKERDQSKLLVWQNDKISDAEFSNLADYLPENSLLVFNNSRVFPARLLFKKQTGAVVEVFCLSQVSATQTFGNQMNASVWHCLIGNAKRWKDDSTLYLKSGDVQLSARILEKRDDTFHITFEWTGEEDFFRVMEVFAELPLPPYMNRKATQEDKKRYQTVYAADYGSVAAPTAGLHFTEKTFQSLHRKGILCKWLTLHVGAGTFKPVTVADASRHSMHAENFSVPIDTLEALVSGRPVICVGTTSMRVVESLFWLGLSHQMSFVEQWTWKNRDETYQPNQNPVQNLIADLKDKKRDVLSSSTSIMITPGYNFKMTQGLITNFHQPRSTLLLLVSAFLGQKKWRDVYEHALRYNYRFLSYGDTSLLLTNADNGIAI